MYFNGAFVPPDEFRISPDDRGLLLGDGLFDTIRVYQGHVFCLQDHFERLSHGAGILQIPMPLSIVELEAVITCLLEKNELASNNAIIRITLTRGHGLRGLLPPADIQPALMITAIPVTKQQQMPVKLHISKQIRRNEQSPLSRIKSLCYLDNILARMEAVAHHADDAILLNTKGHIVSASAANIFLVTDNSTITTPAIEDGVLPGIARKAIIAICKERNLSIIEKSLAVEELATAKEIFISNSIIEIQAVHAINDQVINSGESAGITAILQNEYRKRTDMRLCPVHTSS